MARVVPALRGWLACEAATRALTRLGRRQAEERQLYLTVGCTGLMVDGFDALVRASGIPPAGPQSLAVSHLWLAPVLGRTVLLWSRQDGWSRHEPYD